MTVLLEEWVDIGGFSLSTPGWTHTDLSALLDGPDLRTGSKVIPGGRGVLSYPIRQTLTKVVLPMVIFGDVNGNDTPYANLRAGVEANIETIKAAVVTPPTAAASPDGTRLLTLHLSTTIRTARVRVVGRLQLAAFGASAYRATLDLEFPYGMPA